MGSKLWINKTWFTDAYAKSKAAGKLFANRFGPFIVKKLIHRNVAKMDLPRHVKVHPMIHVSHISPFLEQPQDIVAEIPAVLAPIPLGEGDEHVVDKIASHGKEGVDGNS